MLRLSGELPIEDQSKPEKACRSCAHKFTIFARGSRCYHCGYRYCSNCLKSWAAWPASITSGYRNVNYTAKHVCSFCVDFLRITASGSGRLKSHEFTREKLLSYVRAYNIPIDANQALVSISKDDLIKAITALSKDGCWHLPTENERYYRQHSVPSNVPESQMGFSRGELFYPVTRSTNMNWGIANPWTPLARDDHNTNPSAVTPSSLTNPIGDSTSFRARNPLWESSPYPTGLNDPWESFDSQMRSEASEGRGSNSPMPPPLAEPQESGVDLNDSPTHPSSSKSTLCVVCQDAEANIAIISCGHMALCKGCSDAIMKNTKQCPLCRVVIPAKSHLIRIYKA